MLLCHHQVVPGEGQGKNYSTEGPWEKRTNYIFFVQVLRRLVYLGIKELSGIAEDVIIVTSSLTKDMTGKEDNYRAPAIRALCTITDPVMLQAIER